MVRRYLVLKLEALSSLLVRYLSISTLAAIVERQSTLYRNASTVENWSLWHGESNSWVTAIEATTIPPN